jgi:hypothetical protein
MESAQAIASEEPIEVFPKLNVAFRGPDIIASSEDMCGIEADSKPATGGDSFNDLFQFAEICAQG